MSSKEVMIEEAFKARTETYDALMVMVRRGVDAKDESFKDLIDVLAYYNRMLVKLGAIPA